MARCLTKSVSGRGSLAIPTLALSVPSLPALPGLSMVNSNQVWLGSPGQPSTFDTIVTTTCRNGRRKSLPWGIGGEVRNRVLQCSWPGAQDRRKEDVLAQYPDRSRIAVVSSEGRGRRNLTSAMELAVGPLSPLSPSSSKWLCGRRGLLVPTRDLVLDKRS